MATRRSRSDTSTPAGLGETRLQPVIGYQIAQASVVANRIYEQAVGGPQDLHRLEFSLLQLVAENPGCTAAALARALGISTPNMALWLDRVAAKGLVAREPSTADRRANHLHLTPQGLALAEASRQAIVAAEAAALAHLSFAERAMLAELLGKAAGAPVRAGLAAGGPAGAGEVAAGEGV